MNKIGLFGGTFGPIHLGHLKTASRVQKKLALDEIIFIPNKTQFFKSQTEISVSNRLGLIKKAIEVDSTWHIERFEIDSAGTGNTIDTINYIQAKPC